MDTRSGNVHSITQQDSGPRDLWNLFSAVLPIFVGALPLAENINNAIRVKRTIVKIRGELELIGSNLGSPPFEEHLQHDSFDHLLDLVDKVLTTMETFISVDILEVSPSETNYYTYSEHVKLRLLRSIHAQQSTNAERTDFGNALAGNPKKPVTPLASSFIDFVVSSFKATILFELFVRLKVLNETITDALEGVYADVEVDTRMSDADFAAIQDAADFGVASTALYDLLAEQITGLCDSQAHDGALRLCGSMSPEIYLLFPLCKEVETWHPFTATIQSLDTGSQLRGGNRKQSLPSICAFVKDSKRRRKTAQAIYSNQGVLHKAPLSDAAPPAPQRRVALCELIDPEHSDVCPLHTNNTVKRMVPVDRKRLTVILARSLLYLHGSPWIQHFSLEKLFLCAPDPGKLRSQYPYLHCSIPDVREKEDVSNLPEAIWGHPHVIAFGLRLLEIESGGLIAPEDNDRDAEFGDRVAPYYTLWRALGSLKEDGQIEDVYLNVAQSCLDFDDRLSSVRQPHLPPDTNYRLAIHKFIVSPLLEQLIQRFSDHALDLLETSRGVEEAPSRGVPPLPRGAGKGNHSHGWNGGRYGTPRPQNYSRFSEPHGVRSQRMHNVDVEDKNPGQMRASCMSAVSYPNVKPTTMDTSLPNALIHQKVEGISLFDENIEMTSEFTRWSQRSETYFSLFKAFRNRHMKPVTKRNRIKIAILDTGIDEDQQGIDLWRESIKNERQKQSLGMEGDPIKALRSFVGSSVQDTCGHGTHIVEILMQLAPEADFYIAKISNSLEVETVDQIAEAIDWALAPAQDVDIISMSFGLRPEHVPEPSFAKVEGAIHRAATARKLMFAAASNCGGNAPRTYPATDERVICVNACDGLGFDAVGFNPPHSKYPDYISTLGVGIKCVWDEDYVYKSGTSFATPVAAAIAANVLDFASYSAEKGKMTAQRLRDLQQTQGMRRVFQRFLSEEMQQHRFVAPWLFWKDDVPDDFICQKLMRGNVVRVKVSGEVDGDTVSEYAAA